MSEIREPGWNCSTMCLQTLHHTMAEQGWDRWQPATPLRDYDFPKLEFDLPRRPLDFGVGLWR
jgi:hypothetical protein